MNGIELNTHHQTPPGSIIIPCKPIVKLNQIHWFAGALRGEID
jgi:hypothetical protein